MPLPSGYKFPDVSRYRTVCNWIDFKHEYPVAACKASEGAHHHDSYWPTFLGRMRQFGLLPIAYHFLRREFSVVSQVNNFLSVLDKQPVGIMLDVETSGSRTNPMIAQADEWFSLVSGKLGIPRSSMFCYMPRWWYQAFGGGDTRLRDTILWNSHFSSNPNLSSYAGDQVRIIQYSSTAPITGLCSPGTGDQNILIGSSADNLASIIRRETSTPMGDQMTPEQVTWLDGELATIRSKVEQTFNQVNIRTGTLSNKLDAISAIVSGIEDNDELTPEEAAELAQEIVQQLPSELAQMTLDGLRDRLES